jgi:hypothetical protein
MTMRFRIRPYPLRSTNVCFSCPLVLTPCEGPFSPIPAWHDPCARPSRRSHIEILGDKGIFYKGPRDLKQILLAYTPQYSAFEVLGYLFCKCSPEPDMQQFKSVFLEQGPDYLMSAYNKSMVQGYRLMRKLRNLQKNFYL